MDLIQPAARPAHAKNRPPSAAARWLSCPASTLIVQLYDSDESDASLKGDLAHSLLENALRYGFRPDCDDPDVVLNIHGVLEWVKETRMEYGKDCELYAERKYDIPETGEYGTCDITFVTPNTLHIADYKNGYVPVDVDMNAQMMVYLLGAIAAFGERRHYKITVLQPNYNHRDGPYRTVEVSHEEVDWFRNEVRYSMNNPDEFKAGKHCKKTYCPHRASCTTFHSWARTDARLAWWPSDLNALDDVQLAQALDHAETIQGIRDELRKEAMRRIMQQNREIAGYKIVKSRTDRSFAGEAAREAVFDVCRQLGATDDDLAKKTPESVAGVERFFKAKYKHFGQGKWRQAWDMQVAQHVRDFSGSLTLDKAIDGRPAHIRGGEFGALPTPTNGGPTII